MDGFSQGDTTATAQPQSYDNNNVATTCEGKRERIQVPLLNQELPSSKATHGAFTGNAHMFGSKCAHHCDMSELREISMSPFYEELQV